jgi:hypothetical protein
MDCDEYCTVYVCREIANAFFTSYIVFVQLFFLFLSAVVGTRVRALAQTRENRVPLFLLPALGVKTNFVSHSVLFRLRN